MSVKLQCPRVQPCECGCIHEGVLYLSRLRVTFNSFTDGALVDGLLALFPRLKGRTNMFFLFDHLVALIVNRDIVQSTIISLS
jgi:hypothetical protein